MTFADFAALIRLYTSTNTTTFTDTNIKLLANTFKDQMAVRILGANENYFGTPLVTNLVSNQREYPLDLTVAGQFKFIDAKLDGTNWKRLYERDFNMMSFPINESDIVTAYTGRNPEFAIYRNSIWIMSDSAIQSVSGGLKIWAYVWPANITDLTSSTEMATPPSATEHGWPRQFQELLARRVSKAYKESRDKPIPLSDAEKIWENDFINALDAIMHPNLDRTVIAELPSYDDGSDY